MTDTRFTVSALAPAVVRELLVRDDAGHPPRLQVDTEGGNALRCCLRLSRPGERVALVSYAPLRRWAAQEEVDPGPYDETGPVLLHVDDCPGQVEGDWPPELGEAPRVLRAYARDGRILRGVQVAGRDDGAAALGQLFADLDVAVVHARAVEFGCFTFAVTRTC